MSMQVPRIKPAIVANDKYFYFAFSKGQRRKLKRFNNQIQRHIHKITKNLRDLDWVLRNSKPWSHRYRVALMNSDAKHIKLVKRLNKVLPVNSYSNNWANELHRLWSGRLIGKIK